MDENTQRKISYLHSQGEHEAANALALGEHDAARIVKGVAGDVVKLRDELHALSSTVNRMAHALKAVADASKADAAGTRKGLLDSMPAWKQAMIGIIDRKLHDEIISLEREFNVALSVNARRNATADEDNDVKRLGSTVNSFQRQLSRNSEHVAKLEDRVKSLERN